MHFEAYVRARKCSRVYVRTRVRTCVRTLERTKATRHARRRVLHACMRVRKHERA